MKHLKRFCATLYVDAPLISGISAMSCEARTTSPVPGTQHRCLIHADHPDKVGASCNSRNSSVRERVLRPSGVHCLQRPSCLPVASALFLPSLVWTEAQSLHETSFPAWLLEIVIFEFFITTIKIQQIPVNNMEHKILYMSIVKEFHQLFISQSGVQHAHAVGR